VNSITSKAHDAVLKPREYSRRYPTSLNVFAVSTLLGSNDDRRSIRFC